MHSLSMTPRSFTRLPIPWSATESSLRIGLGWDNKPAPKDPFGEPLYTVEPIDLDVTILAYAGIEFFDQVDFGNLHLKGGGITHLGDNRDGNADGDDESVTIHLNKMDPSISQLFVFVTLFQGGEFKQLEDIFVRLVIDCSVPGSSSEPREKEVCRYNAQALLQNVPSAHKAILVAQIKLDDVGWAFHGVHMSSKGQTQTDFHDMLNPHLTIFQLIHVKKKWLQKANANKLKTETLRAKRKLLALQRELIGDEIAEEDSDDAKEDAGHQGALAAQAHKAAVQNGSAPIKGEHEYMRSPL